MNEFILVEFIFEWQYADSTNIKIKGLGDDFILLESHTLLAANGDEYHTVTGKINSETATAIKLSDKFLSDRMRISYIPDALKDRYRV